MNTSDTSFIDQLTDDLVETKPLMHPIKRGVIWLIVASIYAYGCVMFLGVRHDLMNALTTNSAYLFEIVLMSAIAISAGLGSLFLCVPDMRGKNWLKALAPTLAAVFISWSVIRANIEGLHLQGLHWDHCFVDSMLIGALPAALIMFFTMRGATIYPRTQAIFNITAIAAIGYLGLRITCSMDTVGHAGIYHLAPFIVIGLLIGILAKRIFRW